MNIATNPSTSVPVAPYRVDVHKGSVDSNVSMQWMSRPADQRFVDLTSLRDTKKAHWDNAWEKRSDTRKFELTAPEPKTADDLHKLSIIVPNVRYQGGDIVRDVEISPTHWAFGQLCRLGSAPAAYLREKPSQLVVDMLHHDLRHRRDLEEIKLYGSEAQLFSATGPDYGRIPDYEIVNAIMQIAGNGLGKDGFHWKTPGKLNWSNGTYDPENIGDERDRTFYGSDRDLFIFLVDDRRPIQVGVLKDGSPDLMFRGFYIQNSEVGSRSLKISVFYLRGACENRNLWGCEGFEEVTIRHTAMAPDRWLQQCVPALRSFTEASDRKLIDAVAKAKEAVVAEDNNSVVDFLQKRKFSAATANKIIEIHEREEGKPIRSAWDMAQGMTAFARNKINTDDRLEIELEAKKILDKVA